MSLDKSVKPLPLVMSTVLFVFMPPIIKSPVFLEVAFPEV